MNKIIPISLTLVSILMLLGCAGATSDFECNATTSDTCMTMEQANEKAKQRAESSTVKPGAISLPRLAEGNFHPLSAQGLMPTAEPVHSVPHTLMHSSDRLSGPTVTPVVLPRFVRDSIVDPIPLRIGEKMAGLWIAPYIDTQDVYHQQTRGFFVVKPSAWGIPRVN